MNTALHIACVAVGVVACVLLVAGFGTIAIFGWLLHRWDRAERKS